MQAILTNPVFLTFVFLTAVAVGPTIAYYWSEVRRHEMETALKQAMLERGMSVDEIVRVIEAGQKKKKSKVAVTSGDAPPEAVPARSPAR